VVETQEVQHRGVEIVCMDAVFDGVIFVFVSVAKCKATLDATARHPNGKSLWIIIAAVTALCDWCPSYRVTPKQGTLILKLGIS